MLLKKKILSLVFFASLIIGSVSSLINTLTDNILLSYIFSICAVAGGIAALTGGFIWNPERIIEKLFISIFSFSCVAGGIAKMINLSIDVNTGAVVNAAVLTAAVSVVLAAIFKRKNTGR